MTQSNLQFADHICQRMIANGMVKSQAEFSQGWLDQCPSYLSSSKTRQRNVPDAAVQFLFERLEWRMQNYQAQAEHRMGVKLWRDAYERTMLLHGEVQNYLTWKTVDREDAAFPLTRIGAFRRRVAPFSSAATATLPTPASSSALAKIIEFAKMKKTP